jgi:hypothetical protein
MTGVDQLVAAASKLTKAELKALRLAIESLDVNSPDARFDLDEFMVSLTRLDDAAFSKLRRLSIAIEEDDWFMMSLLYPMPWIEETQERKRLNLAELRFVLEHLYGESSEYFDDYKCSFSFPFLLNVTKGDRVLGYLLRINDFRGSLEFQLRRRVDRQDQVDTHLHKPFEDEFSRKEINQFSAYLYGYLMGRYEALVELNVRPRPFVYRIEANLVIYGYGDGRFFQKCYERSEEFDEAYRRLAEQIQNSPP